jgi:DNA-binding NarL/FixJ family response regulator
LGEDWLGDERRAGDERRKPITVVLVDDELLIRAALAQALRAAGGLELIGEAASGDNALKLVADLHPDVVLMDLRLPGLAGVEVITQLGLLAPASRVLVLTRSEENRVVEAIVAGARGYILKNAPPETIIQAVRDTAAGEAVLSSKIAGKLLERIREQHTPVTVANELADVAIRAALTERELAVFTQLASGATNQEIGRELAVSPHTVSNHIASILSKLQLNNRIQAAVQAVRSGIS